MQGTTALKNFSSTYEMDAIGLINLVTMSNGYSILQAGSSVSPPSGSKLVILWITLPVGSAYAVPVHPAMLMSGQSIKYWTSSTQTSEITWPSSNDSLTNADGTIICKVWMG